MSAGMCLKSYDGEHQWFSFDDYPDEDFPDDDDCRVVLYCCTLCGITTKAAAWQGAPA